MEKPKSIRSLLHAYDPKTVKKAKKINAEGVANMDVYNITAPFKINNKQYILGRAELRTFELVTLSLFFKKSKDKWIADKDYPIFNLQDAFISKVGETIIMGGVEVMQKEVKKGLSFRTVFYKGKSIHHFKRFATGPWKMKGVRLIELPNHKIGVFTRPLGGKWGRGKIGFEIIDSLRAIKPRRLTKIKTIRGMFAKGEWGGVNEVHLLKNNKLGVIGHIAKFSKDKTKRYYYPISFMYDYEEGEFSGLKILATRDELPHGEAKRPDLYDVIYPGGLVRNKNKTATLYTGVADAEAYEITIKDPFLEYEKE